MRRRDRPRQPPGRAINAFTDAVIWFAVISTALACGGWLGYIVDHL